MNGEERRQLRLTTMISGATLLVVGGMIMADNAWQVILLGVALLALAMTLVARTPAVVRMFLGRDEGA